MQQNTFNYLIIGLLGLLIGGGLVFVILSKNPQSEQDVTITPSGQTQTKDSAGGADYTPGQDTQAAHQYNWAGVPKTKFAAVASEYQDLYFEKDMGLTLSKTVDLTGDGVSEAVVTGSGGNNELALIFFENNGELTLAKQKNKDGSIAPVQLIGVGRVKVQMRYEFLPNSHGYYTASMTYNENTDTWSCDSMGVSAYVWNSATSLFEWNAALTATYRAQICS